MTLPHITVCICTWKRPALLARLLERLRCQQTEGRFSYSIVVADNDRLESARSIVENFPGSGPALTYCVEPEQNIARARNKALDLAKGDYAAFIDDDELPEPNWLLALFTACQAHHSDGVLGPVKPFFEQKPPSWLIRGKFCERHAHSTGTVLDWRQTRTGNVLFKREILREIPEPFRPQFGDGGEDNDFFRRMMESRRIFTWCNEAVVFELVSPARFKRSYILKRALLRGQNRRHYADGYRFAKSAAACILYSLALPFLVFAGQHIFMKYLMRLFDHAGLLLTFFGLMPLGNKYLSE
ncbi:MAG: glycosyltransferase [Verrucomicrobia bacterium]|nr:glycosyltransferase [Verrucomicrobiota bacterium]